MPRPVPRRRRTPLSPAWAFAITAAVIGLGGTNGYKIVAWAGIPRLVSHHGLGLRDRNHRFPAGSKDPELHASSILVRRCERTVIPQLDHWRFGRSMFCAPSWCEPGPIGRSAATASIWPVRAKRQRGNFIPLVFNTRVGSDHPVGLHSGEELGCRAGRSPPSEGWRSPCLPASRLYLGAA